jgi:carboxypeptidase D
MDGLWIENGPFRLKPASGSGGWDNIEIDPFSWHTAPAYTLYIDQPVGTGLSFTTSGNYPSDDEKVNVDFYYFLTEFMKLHSDKFTTTEGKTTTLRRPFYFTGESHAGHYIPSMMNYIRKKNIEIKNQPKPNQDSVIMPLTGALIGNGWFDPIYQYSAHEAAYGYGLIGKGQERALAKKEETCRSDLIAGTYTSRKCFSLLDDVIHNSLGGSDAPYTVSQYDQRKWELKSGSSREFPPGHKDVEAYLGQAEKISNAPIQDVLKSIHAMPSWEAGQRYRECTDPPYNALAHQDGLGVTQDIIELLNHMDDGSIESEANIDPGAININKIQLLFFNGIHDLICNHVGNENALENLEWNFKNEFQIAERYGWKSASIDKLGGYMKEYENLYFLKVLNSGHMVPMDVPGVALDMLQTFIYKQSFQTYKQNLNAENGSDSGSSSSCSKCPAQGKCDDDGVSIECPVCGDNANAVNSNTKNNFNSCSRTICENKYDFTSTSNNASTIQNISSSPIVPGVVGGKF